MGPDRGPRGETGDTAAAAPPPAPRRVGLHAAARPPRRRRCSWARTDNTRRAAAREPPDRPQSTAAAGVTGGRALPRRKRWMRSSNSRFTSACVRPMISLLASTTMSYPRPVPTAQRWKLSRNSRRARLRTTAPPTFRLTASPSRSFPCSLGRARITNNRPSSRVPRLSTRSNSACRLSRRPRPNRVGIHPWRGAGAKPPDASFPSASGASGRAGPRACACGRESRVYAGAGGCSAGTSSSSRILSGGNRPHLIRAGQTPKDSEALRCRQTNSARWPSALASSLVAAHGV